ncbi:MAG: exonuclease domain-containing protein [Acetatifactor sp.]|nr:exonuclease domain-containing protein [Acetatifactor sp.]
MIKVFVDLEFCEVNKKIRRDLKYCRCEIIQIGAVKLNDENCIIDRYDRFVKPVYGEISSFITDLTHISEKDLCGACGFEEAMDDFLAWIGEEETTMYSWSNSDAGQIRQESRCKGYDDPRLQQLLSSWVDFQKVFSGILQVKQAIKLEAALNGAGITFEGCPHAALADAENTARLFALTQDEEAFEESAKSILELLRPKPALSVSLGSFFSEELLRQLQGEEPVEENPD